MTIEHPSLGLSWLRLLGIWCSIQLSYGAFEVTYSSQRAIRPFCFIHAWSAVMGVVGHICSAQRLLANIAGIHTRSVLKEPCRSRGPSSFLRPEMLEALTDQPRGQTWPATSPDQCGFKAWNVRLKIGTPAWLRWRSSPQMIAVAVKMMLAELA